MQHRQTEVLGIDPVHPDAESIERAALLLRAGEVVVFPTETVYGLGADALQTGAVEGIFAAKGRPFSDPLIVHIADEAALERLTSSVPIRARKLAQAFWPGPLTLILPRSSLVPKLVTAGLETVAIRMPRHAVALALIRAVGSPIAAPSANRFMHVSPTTAQHALADLGGRVPLILDAGPCEVGVESTVLDLSSTVPTILRPGGVSLETLRTVIPEVAWCPQEAGQAPGPPIPVWHPQGPTHHPPDGVPASPHPRATTFQAAPTYHATAGSLHEVDTGGQRSPGQLPTHYAPAVPLLLFDGTAEAMRAEMLVEVRRRIERGERVGVLVADEDVASFRESGAIVQSLGDAAAPEQVAGALFAGLRTLEEMDVHVILSRSFEERGLGLAVRDRLLKAAGGRVFKRC